MKINKNNEEVIKEKNLGMSLVCKKDNIKRIKIDNLPFSIYFYCLNLLKSIIFNLINW